MTEYIVALDLDGTVVDYENRLSDYTRAVIRAVARRGHHVVIATGRTVDGALDVANRLGLTHGYVVASNGAVIVELDAESDSGWSVYLSLIHISEPTRRLRGSRMPSSA